MCASEDAFDAGCTALVMAAHASTFARLDPPDDDPVAAERGLGVVAPGCRYWASWSRVIDDVDRGVDRAIGASVDCSSTVYTEMKRPTGTAKVEQLVLIVPLESAMSAV